MERENFHTPEKHNTPERKSTSFSRMKALLAAGTLLGLSACNDHKEQDSHSKKEEVVLVEKEKPKSKAETFLSSFPSEIPGAANVFVENESIKGAEKVLVIINQVHLNPVVSSSEHNSPADIYWSLYHIDKVQRDAEKIILFLKEKYGVSKVFMEGISDIDTKNINRGFPSNYETDFNKMLDVQTEIVARQGPKFPLKKERLQKKFSYVFGAPFIMHQKGVIELAHAESEAVLNNISPGMLEINNSVGLTPEGKLQRKDIPEDLKLAWDAAFHQREEFVLQNVAIDPNFVSVVEFGYAHDWRDNVRDWNAKEKNKKIGLVVINPDLGNFSFVTNMLLNSKINSIKGSWIEFHFREFIEKIEKEKVFDATLFQQGVIEVKFHQKDNGLTDTEIERAKEIMKTSGLENSK